MEIRSTDVASTPADSFQSYSTDGILMLVNDVLRYSKTKFLIVSKRAVARSDSRTSTGDIDEWVYLIVIYVPSCIPWIKTGFIASDLAISSELDSILISVMMVVRGS